MESKEPLLASLNKREREILARLSADLSDQQIADELFLSLNTVKWYNRQIYSKLGVNGRIQAITKARSLGLLATDDLIALLSFQASNRHSPWSAGRRTIAVSFTTSFDGTRIAFAIAGNGPPLVKVANYMSHVGYDWDSPVWVHWLEELTRDHTLIHYDERGSGLSDWNVEDISFEAWVRDLEAVVDATGLETLPSLCDVAGRCRCRRLCCADIRTGSAA